MFIDPKPEFDKSGGLWEEFLEFHNSHPEVYETFKKEIFEAIQRGSEVSSIQLMTEHGRWRSGYKINNNHSAYYSRIFIEENPQYKSFFRIRKLKCEKP